MGTTLRPWLAAAVFVSFLAAPAAHALVSINVGSATGSPGDSVNFTVTLSTTGEQVRLEGNTITFDGVTPIASCVVVSYLGPSWDPKSNLKPQGCTPLVDCSQVQFILLGNALGPIPNGPLYVCTVDIAANASPGTYPLTCSDASASSLDQTQLPVECNNGQIQVLPVATPTPSATATPTATPITVTVAAASTGSTVLILKSPLPADIAKTGTITAIGTTTGLSIGYAVGADNTTMTLSSPLPLDVADSTAITLAPLLPTPTATPMGNGGGACAITPAPRSSTGWLWLLPGAAMSWLRRRSRRIHD